MDEQKKYEVIKYLAEHPDGNKDRAAMTLGCTRRHINRMLAGYKTHGRAFFIHGNRGRKPASTISDEVRSAVIHLYRTKYFDSTFQHFTELLACYEGISLSASCVASILESVHILSPRATRAKKKRVKKELEHKIKTAESKKEALKLQTNLVALEDAHSRRPRTAYFGELLQMDASPYAWFGSFVSSLHIAVDDATGTITGAWFDREETLNAYYHVFHQTLTRYGIPYKFFTDRRTIFTFKKKNAPSLDEDTYTQFAYACRQLGVQLESSSVPQAKGRVERMFQTLQMRLPVEFRLRGIHSINEANEFLNSYIKEFNAKFALPLDGIKSAFELQPSDEKINLTLAVLTERTVDSGHCIQFRKKYYRMLDSTGQQVHYQKGTKVMVIQAFDRRMFCCVNDQDIYALEEIPERNTLSNELDPEYTKEKTRNIYIPPMNHPWRRYNLTKFVKSQQHHWHDKDTAVV